ncbi:MAG: phosphatase PAP2 family protein [Bacillota bacterium]
MSGLEILKAIQSVHTPLLDQFFGFVTNLHHETVYILILPLVYWLYDKRFGRYIFSVFAWGFWTNDVLKLAFGTERPTVEQGVRVLFAETGGGNAFPSGHAQTPFIFWGAMALRFRRPWFTWFAAILVFFIGFSRLYLGLHWPIDTIGGFAIGALVLALLQWSQGFWIGEGQPLWLKLLIAFLMPGAALGITALVTQGEMAHLVMIVAGVYAGLLSGSALEEALVGFDPRRGGHLQQVAKIFTGLILIVAIKEGFKLFLPDNNVGDMIRYFSMAFAATLVAPWLFHRFVAPPTKQ